MEEGGGRVIDTLRLTAEEAIGLIERGEVSGAELHRAYSDAIAERDPELHAYLCTVDEPEGDGVPIALKDVISTRGVETTAASKILAGYKPVFDATVAARCKDAALPLLYNGARALVFPSHYEGWGLPVAESLALGKYCISSNAASLPEIAGDLIDYHRPTDVEACQKLVEQALFVPGFLASREQRIGQRFRSTTWNSCSREILRFIAEHGGSHVSLESSHAA